MCKDNAVQMSDEAKAIAAQAINNYCARKTATYANGRDARNFFEKVLVNQANRLSAQGGISDADLCMILPEDVRGVSIT